MTTTWSLAFFLLHELPTTKRTILLVGFYAFVGLSLLAKGLVGIVIPFGVVGVLLLVETRVAGSRSVLVESALGSSAGARSVSDLVWTSDRATRLELYR